MVRQRTSLSKQVTTPGSPEKQRQKRKMPTEVEMSALQAALQAKVTGKDAHLHA